MRLVQVAEMRLVQVAEMRLVQVAEMRLVPWAPPAFLEGGGWVGVGGGGQNRARGRHLTAVNMLSAFSGFQPGCGGGRCPFSADSTSGGERGGAVCFWLIQPARGGGGGRCPLSADSTSEVGAVCLLSADSTSEVHFWPIQPACEGGGGGAVRFQPIQPVGGAHVCKLLLQGGGGGGGGGSSFSPEVGRGAHGTGCLR